MRLPGLFLCVFVFNILMWSIWFPIYGVYENIGSLVLSGKLTQAPLCYTYHLGLVPLNYILHLLYQHLSKVPWIALFFIIQWTLIVVVLINLVFSYTITTVRSYSLLLVTLLIVAVGIQLPPFQEISASALGVFSSALGVLGIWQTLKLSSFRTGLPKLLVYFIICFSGFMWRWEAGVGGLLLSSIFIFWQSSWALFIKTLLIPALLALLIFGEIQRQLNTHPFFKEIEPLVFYVTDSRTPPPIDTSSEKEKIIQTAIRASLMIDSSLLNKERMLKMAAQKKASEPQYLLNPIKLLSQSSTVIWPSVKARCTLTLSYFALLILSVVALRKKHWTLNAVLKFHGSLWLLIVLTAYFLKMEVWHYTPIIQTAMAFQLFFIRHEIPRLWEKQAVKVIVLLLVTVNLADYIYRWRSEHALLREKAIARKEIFDLAGNNPVFFDVDTKEILDAPVMRPPDIPDNVYLYDMAQIPYIPEFNVKLNALCQCNSLKADDFFHYLLRDGKNALYVSTQQRVSLITELLRVVYNLQVRFVPIKTYNITCGTMQIPEIKVFLIESNTGP